MAATYRRFPARYVIAETRSWPSAMPSRPIATPVANPVWRTHANPLSSLPCWSLRAGHRGLWRRHFGLRPAVGDCFNDDPANAEVVQTVTTVDCAEPHDNEMSSTSSR